MNVDTIGQFVLSQLGDRRDGEIRELLAPMDASGVESVDAKAVAEALRRKGADCSEAQIVQVLSSPHFGQIIAQEVHRLATPFVFDASMLDKEPKRAKSFWQKLFGKKQ